MQKKVFVVMKTEKTRCLQYNFFTERGCEVLEQATQRSG